MEEKNDAQTQTQSAPVTQAKTAPASHTQPASAAQPKQGVSALIAALLTIAGLVVGALIGMFVLGGAGVAGKSPLAGKLSLSEGELDKAVASYVYNGQTYEISAREAIMSGTSLESMKKEDGSYMLPSAESVLAQARNAILDAEVQAQKIEVTDEDIEAYTTEFLGTNDISAIATQYSMTEEQAKTLLEQSCGVRKLYDKVVPQSETKAPDVPTAPEDETKADEPTAEYGAYIIGLLGDEWDSEKNTWAREDGPYYAVLGSETFDANGATYTQAETAYYVAYSAYQTESNDASSAWTDYVNDLLANASIDIYSLVS